LSSAAFIVPVVLLETPCECHPSMSRLSISRRVLSSSNSSFYIHRATFIVLLLSFSSCCFRCIRRPVSSC
jgi:hypothetical protein